MKLNKQQTMAAAGGTVAVLAAVLFFKGCLTNAMSEQGGRAYLASLESKDVQSVNEAIQQKKMDKLFDSYSKGETSVFSLFQDYVFLGDSRANGFKGYGYLDSSRVLAEVSQTIRNVDDYLDVIESLKPSTVYISYGINDMASHLGSDRGENGYIDLMKEQIDKILQRVPNAKIVVNSILPASPSTRESNPEWADYDHYQDMVKAACQQYGWTYIDNTDITQNGQAPVYEKDGIHFIPSFYQTWAENIIKQSSPLKNSSSSQDSSSQEPSKDGQKEQKGDAA